MSENEKIVIKDLFQAAHIWRRTGQRPTLEQVTNGEHALAFIFPSKPLIKEAAQDFAGSEFQNFVEVYRVLRGELYLFKNSSIGGTRG